MYGLLITLTVILSVLLIIMVLLQSSKGGGLAGTFGGANVGTMFGTRRTADFFAKASWWLAGIIVVLAITINLFFLPSAGNADAESIIQSGGRQSIPTSPSLPQQQPQTPPTQSK
ncbi:MAG: preprotein translocase subunit SecG [Ignavibacteriaceae bacterium]